MAPRVRMAEFVCPTCSGTRKTSNFDEYVTNEACVRAFYCVLNVRGFGVLDHVMIVISRLLYLGMRKIFRFANILLRSWISLGLIEARA